MFVDIGFVLSFLSPHSCVDSLSKRLIRFPNKPFRLLLQRLAGCCPTFPKPKRIRISSFIRFRLGATACSARDET